MPKLENFDPRLFEVWRKSAEGPVTLDFTTRAEATSFRHRLYNLRAALKTSDNDDHRALYLIASTKTISKLEDASSDRPWVLRIRPADEGYAEALDKAGIPQASLEEPPPLDDLE